MKKIIVVDYKMGNLLSVAKALEKVGANVKVSGRPEDVLSAEAVVLPGVGAFGQAMENLKNAGLDRAILRVIKEGKIFLGLCLGLQLLFAKSEEDAGVKGLEILKGRVVKFKGKMKIPHMGWNQLKIRKDVPLLKGLPDNLFMYFVHSYYVVPEDKSVIATITEYGKEFVSMVHQDNVFATQFHPEKSEKNGLIILKNFIDCVRERKC